MAEEAGGSVRSFSETGIALGSLDLRIFSRYSAPGPRFFAGPAGVGAAKLVRVRSDGELVPAWAAPRSTITCVSAMVVHTISTSKAENVCFDILRLFIGLSPCFESLSSTYIGREKGVKVTGFLKINGGICGPSGG